MVFISYARIDAAEFAQRINRDLRPTHEPWLDRSRIKGGASWTESIETAIDACAVLIALVTPGSYHSPICRAEQLRALRKGKRVIPLLVHPEADRPLYLEHLNYRDFVSSYPEALEALLRDLSDSTSVMLPEALRQTYVTTPRLPPHLIARPDEIRLVRDVLLSDDSRSIGVTALRGLGGTGKTVLAIQVAREAVFQDAFPDGIVWIHLGRRPKPEDLTRMMAEVGRAIEGSSFRLENYSAFEAAMNRLRTVLRTKAALIILDDVWDPADVEPFIVDAPRCHILFTTREQRVALKLGAPEVILGVLRPDQSLAVLKQWARRDDPGLRDAAAALGGHPLALRIAGAQLGEGMTGAEWIAHFGRRVSQIRLTRRSVASDESVEACFLVSLEGFKQDDWPMFDSLGIFPESESVPMRLVAKLWHALEPVMTEFDCWDLAREFERATLLELTPEKTILSHDLVQEFARERLKEKVPRLNALLLESNRAGRRWHEMVEDEFVYWRRNLAVHLADAEEWEELVAIYLDPVLHEKLWPIAYHPGVSSMGDPSDELGRALRFLPEERKPEIVDAICGGFVNRARKLLAEIRWQGSAEMGTRLGALKAADLEAADKSGTQMVVLLGDTTFGRLRDQLYSFVFFCHQAVAVERQRDAAGITRATGFNRIFRDASDVFSALHELDINAPDNISGQLSDQANVVVRAWPA